MESKRIILFAGHYGSGKTNIAVNYAFYLKNKGEKVVITDLDIVNPYFRTQDSAAELKKAGIELISSAYAGSNVDLPALPGEVYSVLDNFDKKAIMDIGGDDRGAYALGRYADKIKQENNYEMLFVFNKYRPLTPDAQAALEVMKEIEEAGKIEFTGIINNSNLGEITTADDVLKGLSAAEELSRISALPIKFNAVDNSLAQALEGKISNIFPLKLQERIV